MVVDIGGGTSEVAVISLGGIVVSQSIRVGGDEMDEAIISYAKREYKLLIGQQTAEELKLEIGSACPMEEELQAEIRGRDMVSGLPKTVVLTSEEIRQALDEPLVQIVDAVKETLDRTPPELASDIMDRGIMLAGGGSLLQGLDERLREETQMPAHLAESPLTCVAVGSGRSLEEFEAIHRSNPIRVAGADGEWRRDRRGASGGPGRVPFLRRLRKALPVYDKTIRRRRAVLSLLVALSLILLTAYFGEAPGGRLHSVQRDFLTVVSPIQDGANKALKPVRDMFGWFGSMLHAKSQLAELRKQNDQLRAQVIASAGRRTRLRDTASLYHLDNELGVAAYHAGRRQRHRRVAEPLELDDRHQQGDRRRGARKRPRRRRRRPGRRGHRGRLRWCAGEPCHRQRDRGERDHQRNRRARPRGTQGRRTRQPADAVPARQHPGQRRQLRRHLGDDLKSVDPRCSRGVSRSDRSRRSRKKAQSSPSTCSRSRTCTTSKGVQVLTDPPDSAPARAARFASSVPAGQAQGAGGAGASEGQLASTGSGG